MNYIICNKENEVEQNMSRFCAGTLTINEKASVRTSYKNARNMLPAWLVEKIQDYVQGENIYIPMKDAERAGWGEANGVREKYAERNMEIMKLHRSGMGISELSIKYCLSECSIKKILSSMKRNSL